MPAFDYIALNSAGRKTRGVLEADSPRSVRQQLKEKSLVPLEVHETKQQAKTETGLFERKHLSGAELALITRQLATLIQAGMPLETCLQAVARQAERHGTRRIMLAVRSKVREGFSFADSLAQFPKAFSDLYCATVAAGEQSGHLDTILDRLADYTEAQQQFHQKIQLALIYPVILLVLSLLIVIGLMVYVVPDIVQVIVDAGQQLPILTEILVGISHFLVNSGIWLLLGLVILFSAARFIMRRPEVQLRWHKHLLNIWLVKRYSRGSNAARYISTLAILTRSGIPLVDAMTISASVLSNRYFKEAVGKAHQHVREGVSLNRALDETGLFPPMMVQLIASGEQSGELAELLQRAAQSQTNDLQQRVAMLLSLFEPLTLLVMGGIVLTIVLAVLLPILNLNQLVQ
ncbi:MAG: type II secretion system inner membrane protein GspF [Porticoccaceae bacterium]|nr:type II secretion system inner membrane protein GspF [Porticoccaceae bacterium]